MVLKSKTKYVYLISIILYITNSKLHYLKKILFKIQSACTFLKSCILVHNAKNKLQSHSNQFLKNLLEIMIVISQFSRKFTLTFEYFFNLKENHSFFYFYIECFVLFCKAFPFVFSRVLCTLLEL